jgi:hypothetical protein
MLLSIILSLILTMFSISVSAADSTQSRAIKTVLAKAEYFRGVPNGLLLTMGKISPEQVEPLQRAISIIIEAATDNNHAKVMEAVTNYQNLLAEFIHANSKSFKTMTLDNYKFSFEYLELMDLLTKLNDNIFVEVNSLPANANLIELLYKDKATRLFHNIIINADKIRSIPQKLLDGDWISSKKLGVFQRSVDKIIAITVYYYSLASESTTTGLADLHEAVRQHSDLIMTLCPDSKDIPRDVFIRSEEGSDFITILKHADLYAPSIVYNRPLVIDSRYLERRQPDEFSENIQDNLKWRHKTFQKILNSHFFPILDNSHL